MKQLIVLLFLFTSFSAHTKPIERVDENYCIDDVYNYVMMRFGPEVQITKLFHVRGPIGMTHHIYFQVDACEGDIIATFHGEGWQCITAQYGKRVQLLTRVYTLAESCHVYIPEEEFPDLYR